MKENVVSKLRAQRWGDRQPPFHRFELSFISMTIRMINKPSRSISAGAIRRTPWTIFSISTYANQGGTECCRRACQDFRSNFRGPRLAPMNRSIDRSLLAIQMSNCSPLFLYWSNFSPLARCPRRSSCPPWIYLLLLSLVLVRRVLSRRAVSYIRSHFLASSHHLCSPLICGSGEVDRRSLAQFIDPIGWPKSSIEFVVLRWNSPLAFRLILRTLNIDVNSARLILCCLRSMFVVALVPVNMDFWFVCKMKQGLKWLKIGRSFASDIFSHPMQKKQQSNRQVREFTQIEQMCLMIFDLSTCPEGERAAMGVQFDHLGDVPDWTDDMANSMTSDKKLSHADCSRGCVVCFAGSIQSTNRWRMVFLLKTSPCPLETRMCKCKSFFSPNEAFSLDYWGSYRWHPDVLADPLRYWLV